MRRLVIGTRGSALALWQANHVKKTLEERGLVIALQVVSTIGDRRLDLPLASIGEKGLFTRELDSALLDRTIDVAVHSLKDLPSSMVAGVEVAAVTERADPWDAFVAGPDHSGGLNDLRFGASVATSSLRRQSQLQAWRKDLRIVPVRGNVETRLQKLREVAWDGMILAEAGLRRLALEEHIRERVPVEVMLPAVGQGALGVVCATNASGLRLDLRGFLHHEESGIAADAERAFLQRIEGGCTVPVAAYASVRGGALAIEGCVAALDGSRLIRRSESGDAKDAQALGTRLAERILAEGGSEVLGRAGIH